MEISTRLFGAVSLEKTREEIVIYSPVFRAYKPFKDKRGKQLIELGILLFIFIQLRCQLYKINPEQPLKVWPRISQYRHYWSAQELYIHPEW